MKHKYTSICLLSLAAIISAGCSDDLGNYSYKDINEVTIAYGDLESGKTYNVISHVDNLTFDPRIVSSAGLTDESNYEFEWRIIPVGAQTEDVDEDDMVVCRERKIDIPVTLAAKKYSCFFNVTDKSTGVTWSTPFYLQVRSITDEGWFVLCDDEGWPRIDIIFNKDATDDIIARDVLAGQDYHPGKPERLMFNYRNGGGETAMLVTDKDTYILDKSDLHAADDTRLVWNFGISPDHVRIKASAKSIYADKDLWVIIDQNDDIYTIDIRTSGAFFEYPVTKINGTEPFKPAPFIGVNLNNNSWDDNMQGCHPAILYDETHSQFLVMHNTSNYPQVMEFSGTKYFDNPTGGKTMVWMESLHSGIIKAVLRDPASGETFYYAMSLRADLIPAPNWWMDDEVVAYNNQEDFAKIIGPNIEIAEKFTFHNLYPYMFYLADNKIYQFNLADPTTPAKEVLSFPGETITEMKFNPFVAWARYEDWERAREYDLVVGTNVDGKANDNCGIVRFFNVPNLMQALTEKKKVEGFGKIMEIVYKERAK